MKRKRCAVAAAVVLTTMVLCVGTVAAATLGAFTVTDEVDPDWMSPMGSKSAFDAGTRLIWATVHLSDAPAGTNVTAVVYRKTGPTMERLTNIEQRAEGTRYIAFSLQNDGGFAPGTYRVRFLLDGEEQGSVNFRVAGGAQAAGKASGPGPDKKLDAQWVGLAGIDAYGVLWPSPEPRYYGGEAIALLLRNVGPFTAGPDGKHWLDLDYRITDANGAVIGSGDGILGEQGRVALADGVATSPFVQFDQTTRIAPGVYGFTVTVRDRIGGTRAAYTRDFTIVDLKKELASDGLGFMSFALNLPPNDVYTRYIDPLRRFGVWVPMGWTLMAPEDQEMSLYFALDPNGGRIGMLKVHVYDKDLDGAAPRQIIDRWKATLAEAARQGSATLDFFENPLTPSDSSDPGLKPVLQALASSGALLEYSLADGRKIVEFKTAVFVEDHLSVLTFLAEQRVWDEMEASTDKDWDEAVPGSFLSMTPHWLMLRLSRPMGG